MFAVVEVAGKQYKVAPKDTIMVPTLNEKPGTKVRLDRVLMVGDEKGVVVGRPLVSGAQVEATVLEHAKMDKVIAVSYTHLRAHETVLDLVCRLLLEKKPHSRTSRGFVRTDRTDRRRMKREDDAKRKCK